MGRIFYIMGKSATGKDTVFKELLKRRPELTTVVPYTTCLLYTSKTSKRAACPFFNEVRR